MDRAPRKILRSPSLKRKNKQQPLNQKVSLERVLGLTVSSNANFTCDPNTGTIAYPAGCSVVLFNTRRNKQTHIINNSKKSITSLAFSGDGKHLVTGECGHQPAVRVWDVERTQVAEFHGHKFGISCAAFSPNLRYLVSVGTQHDMIINVWNWRSGNKVASNKFSCKVSNVAFSHDGSYFVTVGNRHVKFWYLESSKSRINETVPLQGRSGLLSDQKNNFFCGVLCGRGQMAGSTFCITQSGLLCEFNAKRLLVKWVELRTKCATSISGGEDHIFIGCADGIVRVFSAKSLHFLTSLPHPHYLGVDVSSATSQSQMKFPKEDAKYPDTIAVAFDDDHKKVTCVYNDHSLYQWDVHDIKKVGKAYSVLYHSSCVWSLEVYPMLEENIKATLPPGSFLTGSSDDTVRVWNLDSHMQDKTTYKRNIYSHDLLKIIYADEGHTNLCDVDYNPAGGADKTDTQYDVKNGIRSIRVSPDGLHLAAGDKLGNLRVYDTEYMDLIRDIEAHEADVLCLEYSYSKQGPKVLASASRDRLIHVFDVEQNYGLLQTLDDHSASIQAVRFTDQDNQLKMLSCGADKSLLFRNAIQSPEFQFSLDQHLVSKATLYDMVTDPTQKFVATACQDRNVRIYNIRTAKQKKNYKGSLTDDGVLLRIQLDPSGCYAATSCTDKNICIVDFYSGELVANMYGHSETITGIKFMNDLKHVISVSADGCIFVWRLPSEMTKQMKNRMEELGKMPKDLQFVSDIRRETAIISKASTHDGMDNFPVLHEHQQFQPAHNVLDMLEKDYHEAPAEESGPDYRFSVGPLPNWAKAKMVGSSGDSKDRSLESAKQPKGRWAERADTGFAVKTQSEMSLINTEPERRRFTHEGEALQSQFAGLRRETMVIAKDPTTQGISFINDDDETNIDDDEEFCPAFFSTHNKSQWDLPDSRPSSRNSDPGGGNTSGSKWGSRFSLNLERNLSIDFDDTDEHDTGSETPEVIYYPPSEVDSSETYPDSYQVFNSDLPLSRQKHLSKRFGMLETNIDEADSESTDPISLEDDENDDTLLMSNPSTPSDPDRDFLARTPDKEKFVHENFETINFTPVATDKFTKALDSIEQDLNKDGPLPFSPRLSISSRFLSRAQQSNIKNMSVYSSIQRQDNWFDPLQKSKTEMARAVDDTRKRLLAMGWNSNNGESPEKEPPSPPSPPTKLESTKPHFPMNEDSKLSIPKLPPSPCGSPSPKTLRRFWYTLDLPKQPIIEEPMPLPKIPLPPKIQNRLASIPISEQNGCSRLPSLITYSPKQVRKTRLSPISRRGKYQLAALGRTKVPVHLLTTFQRLSLPTGCLLGWEASVQNQRTLERDPLSLRSSSTGKLTDLDTKTNKSSSKTASYLRPTRSSKAKIARASSSSSLPDDGSQSSTNSMTKATSMLNLSQARDPPTSPKKKSSRTLSKTAFYASTPNLAVCLEEEEEDEIPESASNLKGLADLSRSVPDINDMDGFSSSTESTTSSGEKRTDVQCLWVWTICMWSRSPPGTKRRSVSPFSDKNTMPPPPSTAVSRSKHDAFLKRAQAKRRTTADMTLDRAKDILLGKSGILKSSMESVNSDGPGSRKTSLSGGQSQSHSRSSSASSNVFESEYGYTSASTLATVEDIENTAEEFAERAADASPNDLPERDQNTSLPSRTKSPMSSSSRRSSNADGARVSPRVLSDKKKSQSVENLNDTPSKEQDSVLPSVRARVAQYMSLNKSTEDLGSSPRPKASLNVNVNTYPSHSPAPSPVPMGRSPSADLKVSPRSQSDTGLGSDTDTDSEIRRPDKSTSHPRLSLVNGDPSITHSVSLTTPVSSPHDHGTSPTVADRSGLSLSLTVKTDDGSELVMPLIVDLKEILQTAKQVYEKCKNMEGSPSMSVLHDIYQEAADTFSELCEKSKSSQSKDKEKKELSERDKMIVNSVVDKLQPSVDELSHRMSRQIFHEVIGSVVAEAQQQ
ncbi:LOW QUALITY PROTEIN: mitogen-activated protein kinase-binding protein 1-like [Haliotis rubra]|uniref:LOW QUALITY PROTEIN: mitogen-activated protein kinase-binding protein 1-like n=1 Tax=Haliotis rubra TaxID=36100 RepID=UPI001EE5A51A|nr:LOW QUALITY PROTEIN: mitogen-activated protein kinase-binding protein 1-like [Haliotis rubra]